LELAPEMLGKQVALRVTLVVPSTPGDQAGILAGDKLQKINGQTFRTFEDFKKKLDRIGPGVRFPLTVDRNGTPQTVTIISRTRPVVGSPEWAALQENERAVRVAQTAAASAAAAAAAMAAAK